MKPSTFSTRLSNIVAAIICTLAVSPRANAESPREIAQKAFPSTVLLVMEDSHGQPLSLGSGFVVTDQIVASNLHVVEGASGGYAKLVNQSSKFEIEGTVGVDAKHDLVLLKVKGLTVPALPLGESDTVAVGEDVYAVGNPRGLEGTFSAGIISGIRSADDARILQITAPVSPGSSGGPVLNASGVVIGVAVAFLKGGQNLNFAIPVSDLKNLLSARKPISVLSATKNQRAESLVERLGDTANTGVVAVNLEYGLTKAVDWRPMEIGLAFSLKNNLRSTVKNVNYRIIYYDTNREPIDYVDQNLLYSIPGNLAKRATHFPSYSVRSLLKNPKDQIEIRVLSFEIKEDGKQIGPGSHGE